MNRFTFSEEMAEIYKKKYPKGTRIELIDMPDDPNPIPSGTRGTVTHIDDIGQISVKWDNGRGLSLIPGVDSFKIINE